MSPLKKRSSLGEASGEPPREDSIPSSSSSLTSLPEEIIFNCLIRVPRYYHQNLCRVSKTLRSLVRSPEFHHLRSLLPKPKDSVYVLTYNGWLTLRATEKTATKIEYRLVSNPIPFPTNQLRRVCSTVVGSEILFIGGSFEQPSSELWILDTRSGELTQGPSMNVARRYVETVVGKIDGKVYVIGGWGDKEIHVEVFNPKSPEWKVAQSPKKKQNSRMMKRLSASVNGKVYIVEDWKKILVYDPRSGQRFEILESPSSGVNSIQHMFVVDDVLYAYYNEQGLMGFDAKRKVWRRVVGLETLDANFSNAAMVEYDGMLAIFWTGWIKIEEVRCALIELDWIGDVIRGTIEWHGTVATIPNYYQCHEFSVCSD